MLQCLAGLFLLSKSTEFLSLSLFFFSISRYSCHWFQQSGLSNNTYCHMSEPADGASEGSVCCGSLLPSAMINFPQGLFPASRRGGADRHTSHSLDSTQPKITPRKMCTQDTQAFDTAGGNKLTLICRLTSCLPLKLVLISSFHFLSILFLAPQVGSCTHFLDMSFADCPLHT